MPDLHYSHPRLAALYDHESGWSPDRDFYLAIPERPGSDILDLGCGTGLLCEAYAANGHRVTGVDPAAPMLEVARRKPHGTDVDWVHATAEDYRTEKRFDLIVMTGHAFQVHLTDRAIDASMRTLRRHLKPGARIVFESRNPAIDWAQIWNFETTVRLETEEVRISRVFRGFDADILSFDLRYRFPSETLSSTSRIRFLSRRDIEQRLVASSLRVDAVYGDWDRSGFDEARSHEIIFVAREAP